MQDLDSRAGLRRSFLGRGIAASLVAGAALAPQPVRALSLTDIRSVKDYGAVGNGSTDDTAAIQSAMNGNSNGVYFPRGQYRVTSTLTNSGSGLVLFGDGPQASEIRVDFASGDVLRLGDAALTTFNTNVEVRGLSVNSASARSSGAAISLNYILFARVSDCLFINQYDGIVATLCTAAKISDVNMLNSLAANTAEGCGIIINRGTDYFLARCFVKNDNTHGVAGLYVKSTTACWVSDCDFIGYAVGLKIEPDTNTSAPDRFISYLFLSQCAFDSCSDAAILVSGPTSSEVLGIRMTNCWGGSSLYGLKIVNSGATTFDGFEFNGCRFVYNDREGVRLDSGTINRVNLQDCTVAGNSSTGDGTYSGIYVGTGVSGFRCVGGSSGSGLGFSYPSFSMRQKYGIELASGASSDITIVGVDLSGTGNRYGSCSDGSAAAVKNIAANGGFVTCNNGVANFTGGTTTLVVNHGLSGMIPTYVEVTFADNPGGTYWVTNRTTTSFTVNLSAAPSGNTYFFWRAGTYLT